MNNQSKITNDSKEKGRLNKLVLHPLFKKVVAEIGKVNVTITESPRQTDFDFSQTTFPPNGKLRKIEALAAVDLDSISGQEKSREYKFTGYDESKLNYISLEGIALFTAHSLVVVNHDDYIPVNYLSFYFYTRSENLQAKHPLLSHSKDPLAQSNYDYVSDRTHFLENWSLEQSISFIDGPLIGGNMTSYTLSLVDKLHSQQIIPIFIVKNSDSNLVTDNIKELKDKYNSDMHWSHNFLKTGQRTSFFTYTDEYNAQNAKVFCYLKAFPFSPQRVEMHVDTYKIYKNQINEIMDLVYYLFLAHGDIRKPQVRPIAVAEKFARDVLKLSDSYRLIKSSGLIPTMNQERFGA